MQGKTNSDHIKKEPISSSFIKEKPSETREKIFDILNNIKDEEVREKISRPIKKIYKIVNYINQIQEQQSLILIKKSQHQEEIAENCRKLNILQIQAIKISQVLENVAKIILAVESERNRTQKLETILEEFQFLGTAQVQVTDPEQLNVPMMNFVNQQLYAILRKYKSFWKQAFTDGKIKQEKSISSIWNDFKIYKAKLDTFLDSYPYALIIDKNDLFCQPQNCEIWENLRKHIQEVQYDTPEKVEKIIKKFKEAILMGNAMIAKQKKEDTSFIWASVYFLINKEKSQRQAQVFLSEADEASAFSVWNLLENSFIREAMKLILPSISFNQKIYVPKIYKQITVSSQNMEIKNKTINKINQDPLDTFEVGYDESIFKEPKDMTDRVQIRILNHRKLKKIKLQKSSSQIEKNLNNGQKDQLYQQNSDNLFQNINMRSKENSDTLYQNNNNMDSKQNSENDKNINLSQNNNNSNNNIKNNGQTENGKSIQQMYEKQKIDKMTHKYIDKIVIHVHGGGFVAMSSRSHQPYTRIWSNKLQVPVFSIDYGLAPKNPYPSGLNDVWQAYNWIINNIHKYYYINPKKIILAGDSAGGNLIVGLMGLIIKHKIQKPIAIFPIYPVLNLDLNRFTPSHLISLDDVVLSHWVLKLCQKAYLKDEDIFRVPPDQDPQISPLVLSDEILKEFPTTRMMVGTEDPLYDDSLQFLHRLVKLNRDCKLQIFNGFPHGFLGFDPPIGVEQNYKEMDLVFRQYD